jgi:hypothetical protein
MKKKSQIRILIEVIRIENTASLSKFYFFLKIQEKRLKFKKEKAAM